MQFKLCPRFLQLGVGLHLRLLQVDLKLRLRLMHIGLHLHLLDLQRQGRLLRLRRQGRRVLEERLNVLETRSLGQLRRSVVDVLGCCQSHLHALNLKLQDAAQALRLRDLVARTQPHMNGHVVAVAPFVGVVLHKLIAQAEGQLLHAAIGQGFQDALEDRLQQNLGKDAGNQFNALLCCALVDLPACCGVVQAVRVQAHRGARNPGAVFPHALDVLQHGHGRTSRKGRHLLRHRVG